MTSTSWVWCQGWESEETWVLVNLYLPFVGFVPCWLLPSVRLWFGRRKLRKKSVVVAGIEDLVPLCPQPSKHSGCQWDALSFKGKYLRDVLEGEGLAGKYFIDTESNFKPAFSTHAARIEKANCYCLGATGGRAPKLLQLINPDNHTPAALPSSICLWVQSVSPVLFAWWIALAVRKDTFVKVRLENGIVVS